ncbi:molybdopterin-dependent oxidoreductase [Sulfitobacter sp. S190]|uniref:molybdopterin-dependent oxidoreductase n=1 Tax=Sulfitobacter sp. S190 TaxID=2867022 RepID=UPI0021A93FCC|nr:molybdopterin-dependent oxidoreductase [Sulfitobacter sp. S190]UWR24281.1 molybdopterin-dependent oxidoreductase [Sulfitobacter sp. S190]
MNERPRLDATRFTLDGNPVEVFAAPGERLSQVLREKLDARDVKIGCNAGDCGACTVLLDGAPVCACLTPAQQAQDRHVETLRGLHASDKIAPMLAQRFADHGAAQCGICIPGMMVSAVALLRRNPAPSETEVGDALGGVLCRCTGYRKIIDAVMGLPAQARHSDGAVGASIARVDGAAKTGGKEIFGDDIAPPGTLEIFVVRAPHHRAKFTLGDCDAFAAQTRGITSVLTARDVPGRNLHGVIPQFMDQPVFATDETRFRGEAVAAVVGTPEAIAAFDPTRFPVTWEPLDALTDIAQAQAEDAPCLHMERERNVMCTGLVEHGDADAAMRAADVTVEGHFKSGFVEHAYIEPEAGYARLVDGRLELHVCTQAPVMNLDALEIITGMSRRDIRIRPTSVGGGFGAKLDLTVHPYLALAAIKTGQPVRLAYGRVESMQSSTKRHPSDIHMKIGADHEGRVVAATFDGSFDTGAYASWGPTVANRVPVHASGPYRVPHYRARSKGVHTNQPPSGAFRGFGVPQSAIAQESLFDELADKLGIDRLEFRIRNALRNGQPTVCGQVFEQGVGIEACLTALRTAWQSERADCASFNAQHRHRRRGVGVAGGWYGCGNTSLPNPSTIKCGLRVDGTVVLHQGAVDIGQGSNTVISQIFATALGVPVESIERVCPDTDLTPDAGKTSASRQTFVTGNAALRAATQLRTEILKRMNAAQDAKVILVSGAVTATDAAGTHRLDLADLPTNPDGYVLQAQASYDPPTRPMDALGQGHPYAQFGYAAHLVVVEVDTAMGTTRAIRAVAAHDVGKAINPVLVEGQVHGGFAQGLGMALMEEYLPGRTENLHDYLIPTIGDIPPIETVIIEEPDAHGPYGAKGLGEHALIPTAPAILNAIHDATGARITSVPATPERVRAAIRGLDA